MPEPTPTPERPVANLQNLLSQIKTPKPATTIGGSGKSASGQSGR